MQEFLEKNKKEILIIFGTIAILFFLLFSENEITNYLSSQRRNDVARQYPMIYYYIFLFSPGIFSAFLSALIWKNLKKTLEIGSITTILWYISYFMIGVLSYRVH